MILDTTPTTRIIGASVTSMACLLSMVDFAQAATVDAQGSWQSTLKARDLNRDKIIDAYYDAELNITWLKNWNLGAGTVYDTPYGFGSTPATDGLMIWSDAVSWANSLSIGTYTGWRLPTMTDTGAPGCDFSFAGGTDCGYNVRTKEGTLILSELAHMWYSTLGNKSYCIPGDPNCSTAQTGWGLTNAGPFANVGTDSYWLGLPFYTKLYGGDAAWRFGTYDGRQSPTDIYATFFSAVAVHTGDVGQVLEVPEPAIHVLTAAGLILVITASRRNGRRKMPVTLGDA